jgi:hypothetical protein
MNDPLTLLRDHVRQQADAFEPNTNIDELIAHITLEHHRESVYATASPVRPRRRWSSAALGIALCIGIGTGAVVTAAVLDRVPVENPEAGVLCHTTRDVKGSSLMASPGDDPITACAVLWNDGSLPVIGEVSEGTNPPLVACAGPAGAVEVFPGSGPGVCTSLGLAAIATDTLVGDRRTELGSRLQSEINMLCLPPREAQQAAAVLLDELGFEGWVVVQREGEGCGLVAFGVGADRTLYVNPTPPP